MKFNKLLTFILVLSSLISSAQLMNVRKWRPTERDSLDKALELFDEKMFLRALPIFENLLAQHSNEEFLKYSYAKCALYRSDKHEDAYNYFKEVYNNNKKVPDIQYDMALAALYNYKFDEATDYITQYDKSRFANPDGKKNAELLKRNIVNAKYYLANPTNAKVTNLGAGINSEYDEYVPAITADESALIFTYAGAKSLGGRQNENLSPDKYGNFLEDIYISRKQNNVFQAAVPLDSLNTTSPDAAISMSEDGSILYIYQDIGDGHGDIYQSFSNGDQFTKPQKLKGEVNSYSWDGHCSISPDGRTLYFSSERAGGFGGRDIYKASLLLPDSVWGNVVNLGDSVNTAYDDDAPFIHADGITLFYSSKGRSSMGGYDVFRTVMRLEDSTFKKTENLGYPINSSSDDIYFVMGASGKVGYYSSGKKEGRGMKDIYQVEPNFNWPKPSLYLVKGSVKTGNTGVESTIKVEITSKNNRLYKTLKSNSKTGEYLVSLPPGVSYQLTYSYKNLPEKRFAVDAVEASGYVEKINNVNFEEIPDVLASNTASLTKTKEPALKTDTPKPAETTPIASVAAKTTPTSQPLAVAEKTPTATGTAVKEVPVPEEVINHVPIAIGTPKTQTTAVAVAVKKEEPVNPKTTAEPVAVVEKKAPVKKDFEEDVVIVEDKKAPEIPVAKGSGTPIVAISVPVVVSSKRPIISTNDFTANPVTSTPLNVPAKTATASKTEFVPVNGPQAKAVKFTEKYSDVTANDMEFRVQVAAVKNDNNTVLPNQKALGKIEKLNLNDGFIRITVGGSFKTLGEALEHNKKVVRAGQKEGFIIALYQGKRVSLDELEKMGLLK
ncbi:hypothetical protein CNR22_16915 [Sphingobacteriaceae bacterium]|nr:hypothetical protein CNR22_16915 [Sphingobacteriaceae bacterium]